MKVQKYVVVPPPPPPSPVMYDITLTHSEVQVLFNALSAHTNNLGNSVATRAVSDDMWEALYATWSGQAKERVETGEEAE